MCSRGSSSGGNIAKTGDAAGCSVKELEGYFHHRVLRTTHSQPCVLISSVHSTHMFDHLLSCQYSVRDWGVRSDQGGEPPAPGTRIFTKAIYYLM